MNNANITSSLPSSSLSTSSTRNLNNYKIKLALNILGDHFGDLVRDVAKVLVDNENCTLMAILRTFASTYSSSPETIVKPMFQQSYSNSSAVSLDNLRKHEETVRHALLTLHTHSCVFLTYPMQGIDSSSSGMDATIDGNANVKDESTAAIRHVGLIYKLDVDNIINRLRLPHLMLFAKTKFGALAVDILDAVVLHGKIKFPKIQESVVAVMEGKYQETAPPSEGSEEEEEEAQDRHHHQKDEVQRVFEHLVQARFLLPAAPLQTKKQYAASSDHWAAPVHASPGPANSTTSTKAGAEAAAKATVMKKTVEDRPSDPNSFLPMELQLIMAKNKHTSSSMSVNESKSSSSMSVNESKSKRRSRDAESSSSSSQPTKKARVSRKQTAVKNHIVIKEDDDDDLQTNGTDIDRHKSDMEADARKGRGNRSSNKSSSEIKEDVVWTICWDQLLRECRHKACIGVATSRMGFVAGVVVRIILERSMNSEVGPNQLKSAPLSSDEILKELQRKLDTDNSSHSNSNDNDSDTDTLRAPALTTEERISLEAMTETGNLRSLLDVLRLDSLGILLKVVGSDSHESGPLYMVNKESIIAALQKSAIHKTCVERYGNASGRIIQLLYRSKYLDQQVISDSIIIPARETRERLYRLHLDKWINYIELSKRIDFNSATNYYFWYLDPQRVKTALLDHLFKAMYNVRLRHTHEYEQNKNLLELTHITTEYDQARLRSLNGRFNALDKVILDLDRTVLLLERF